MNTSLGYLPINKQTELMQIVSMVHQVVSADLIILFGSYARNQWVEDKYDEYHYRYQSDFDILVIVETKSESIQGRFEREIEDIIEKSEDIKTPVSVCLYPLLTNKNRLFQSLSDRAQ